MFKIGDKVRDGGKYPYNCDGTVLSISRHFWTLTPRGWYKQRAMYSLVVRFANNEIEYYQPDGSKCLGMKILYETHTNTL